MSPDDILAELPDPREDEPAALRNDIAEELADHLICGVRREMVKGHDEPTAWKRTLERFGDPRQIARKLWWQAMRSKIMGQRIILGFQAAIFVGMIVMAGVLVSLASSQRRQLAEQQELVQEALAQLTAIAAASRDTAPVVAPRDPTRNHVQFRVVEGTVDGPILKNAVISLWKPTWKESVSTPAVTADGLLDYGYMEPGLYNCETRVDFQRKELKQIVIHPGIDYLDTIVVPPLCEVQIEIEVPPELQDDDTVAELSYHRLRTEPPFENWKGPDGFGVRRLLSRDEDPQAIPRFDHSSLVIKLDGNLVTRTMKVIPGKYACRHILIGKLGAKPFAESKIEDQNFEVKAGDAGQVLRIKLPGEVVKAAAAVDRATLAPSIESPPPSESGFIPRGSYGPAQ